MEVVDSLKYRDSRPLSIHIFSVPILNSLHPFFNLLTFIFYIFVMEAAHRTMTSTRAYSSHIISMIYLSYEANPPNSEP